MVKPLTDRLLHRRLPTALLMAGHIGKLREESSYDTPPTYRASCSCGWEIRVVAGSRARSIPGTEAYVAAYGDDVFLDEGAIYGTAEDALALLLQHLAPDFPQTLSKALGSIQTHRQQGGAIALSGTMKLLKEHTRKLVALVEEYDLLQELQAFQLATPPPVLPAIPEAHRLAAQQLSQAYYSPASQHQPLTKDMP